MLGQILVYSIIGCPHCIKAKQTLKSKGLGYIEISIDRYEAIVRTELQKKIGASNVPQIFFNEKLIGGNDELQKLIADVPQWDSLVSKVTNEVNPSDGPQPPSDNLLVAACNESKGDFQCEPDAYYKLVTEMREAGIVRTHKKMLLSVKNSFSGLEFVDWVKGARGLDDAAAISLGQELVNRHFGHSIKSQGTETIFQGDDTLYRLLEDDDNDALNAGSFSSCEASNATELAESLRRLVLAIYDKHISFDGRSVDYASIGESPDFSKYVALTKELQRVDIVSVTREEKVAFFINVYNALVIHGFVARGQPSNMLQRWKFFNTVRYIIGGCNYSLQDIENGVLRGNRKGVAMLSKPFSKTDLRLKVALDSPEPLIHFALVCGAKSCPPIKTYSVKNVLGELKLACESFLSSDDAVLIQPKKNKIFLSQIFSWYGVDFGNSKLEIVKWIFDHMQNDDKKEALKTLLEPSKSNPSISFLDYNWSVNSK